MKTFLCALLMNCWQTAAPPQSTVLLHEFIQDVARQQLSETELADKYMCTTLLRRNDEVGNRVRMIFRMTITEYRTRLRERKINPNDIIIVPFDELAVKPVEIAGDTEQVYEAQYGGKHFSYLLMENGKIASLNLLHKDVKMGFFLSYCE